MSEQRPRVYVARVGDYEPAAIAAAVRRGLDHTGQPLRGNAAATPNLVFAHRRLSPAAYTRPEVVHGALEVLLAQRPDLYVVLCGNSGLGVSTRRMAAAARGSAPGLRRRGYLSLPRLHRRRVALRPTDEAKFHRYQLSVGRPMTEAERRDPDAPLEPEARYWERVVTGWELYHADSVVLFPKLKSNVLSHGLSAAIKLQGIGLLRDGDRLDGHDWNNDRRMVDMLEVTDPDLIITDAIDIGLGGNQMTQAAHRLGAVLVADNAVAHDAVCAHIMGLDPTQIPHLALAAARGYGPLDLDAIDLVSEEPLATLRLRVRGFGGSGFMRVDRFGEHFEAQTGHPFPLQITAGEPYDVPGTCGVLLDWLYTAYDDPLKRERMKRWPPGSVFVGVVTEEPTRARVFVVGDRGVASFAARAAGYRRLIQLPESVHKALGGPRGLARYRLADGRMGWAVEIPGDPPSHRDLILGFFVGSLGRLRASMMRLDLMIESYLHGTMAALRRRRRNAGGIAVVHARKIKRLLARPWRQRTLESPRLARTPELDPLPPLPPPRLVEDLD